MFVPNLMGTQVTLFASASISLDRPPSALTQAAGIGWNRMALQLIYNYNYFYGGALRKPIQPLGYEKQLINADT